MDSLLMRYLVLLFTLTSHLACANGWMSESPYLKGGEIIIDSSIDLVSEDIYFELYENKFITKVTYNVQSSTPSYSGTLSFPVLCKSKEYETDNIDCINDFSVSINGIKTSFSEADSSELLQFEKQFKTNVYDKNIISQHFNKGGIHPTTPEQGSYVKLFNASIHSSGPSFSIKVEYSTPYYYNWSGFTKSSLYYYSNDLVFYDFRPASSWVEKPATKLSVIIKNIGAKGEIVLPSDWSFDQPVKGTYSAKISPFVPAKTKNLIIGINQSNFKQYKSHKETNKNIEFSISSTDTLPHKKNRYEAQNASDSRASTAWCTRNKTSKIRMEISPKASKKPYHCQFEGIGIMNGYTKSEKTWRNNRKVKRGIFRVNQNYAAHFELPLVKERNEFIAYDFIQHIASRANTILGPTERSDIYLRANSTQELIIEIEILETYKGEKYEDTCISEIFPLYNCG